MSVTENDRIKKRMQRFGEVISQKGKTLDETERLKKRQERFGVVGNGTINNANKNIVINNSNDKIQKRQERFGVVSNNNDKILPVCKLLRKMKINYNFYINIGF